MRKFVPILFLFMLVSGVLATPAPVSAEPSGPELAQSGNIMQCMEQCIRSEGASEKATCKSRCANVSSKRPKQKDCMGNYKKCQKSCGKNKDCKRSCKARLMKCS